jgi:hypothetical protein
LTETPNTEVEDTPNVIEEIAEEVIEEVQPEIVEEVVQEVVAEVVQEVQPEIVEETPAIAEEPAPVVEENTDTTETEQIATEVTKVSMSDLKKMTIEEKFEYASLAFNNDEVDKADICIEVFRKLANEGFAPAQYQLAECYFSGFGVKQNYQQSATWHNKAAGQGFAMSQLMLGYKYELAQGCIQNYQNAAKWYRKAADQNEPEAQYRLGLLYIDGNGVIQNEKKGSALIESAASQGHPEATEWIKAKSGKKIQKNESTKEPIKQEFAINNVKVSTDGCSDIYFNINWTGPKKTDKNVEIRLYKGKKGWLDSCIYPPQQARLKTDSLDLSLKSKVLNKCTFYIELGDVEYTQDGREKKWEVLATYGPFTRNIYFEHRLIGKNKLEIR